MKTLIVNDVHLGVQRTAGTTPKTSALIRNYLQESLYDLLMSHIHVNALVVNGDLFDGYDVAMTEILTAYHTLCAFLESSGAQLRLIPGNHDLSKSSERISAFEFLAKVLVAQYPGRVFYDNEPGHIIGAGYYSVPHLANQDLFNAALGKLLDEENLVVFLHANFDNNFAVESDHSLNVSRDQAKALVARGHTLYFGHEHQAREELDGNVFVAGNQWPSSVADCLNNQKKFAYIIEDGEITPVETWDSRTDFAQVDWQDLSGHVEGPRFIRVTGTATSEQAAEVVEAISKFRQKSNAFVITNATKVEGAAEMEDLPTSIELAKEFDVLEFLFQNLEEEQVTVVKALLEKQTEAVGV